MTPAEEWARLLRRALRDRGVSGRELANRLGCGSTVVYSWTRAISCITHANAIRVAEALDYPSLLTMSIRLHSRPCAICGTVFLDAGNQHKALYCSTRCQLRAYRERRYGPRRRTALLSLPVYQKAVDAFCRACEPEGLCRTSTCELRNVSPLPLADERVRVA